VSRPSDLGDGDHVRWADESGPVRVLRRVAAGSEFSPPYAWEVVTADGQASPADPAELRFVRSHELVAAVEAEGLWLARMMCDWRHRPYVRWMGDATWHYGRAEWPWDDFLAAADRRVGAIVGDAMIKLAALELRLTGSGRLVPPTSPAWVAWTPGSTIQLSLVEVALRLCLVRLEHHDLLGVYPE